MARTDRDGRPAALILARAAASRCGDYGFVYDSYLEDSNFRRQFPHRADYLAYARASLLGVIELQECRVLRERIEGDAAEVLFFQRIAAQGAVSETLERAWLRRTVAGWRFDCSERLERASLAQALETIDWDDFARASGKVLF